jgi:hypothetical protein
MREDWGVGNASGKRLRVLHADIARLGEGACRQRRRVERFLITLLLGILIVSVLHFSCFFEEWIPVSSPITILDKQRVCKESLNCGFAETWSTSSTPQSHRLRARGAEQGRRTTLHTVGAPPSAALRRQTMLHRHLE